MIFVAPRRYGFELVEFLVSAHIATKDYGPPCVEVTSGQLKSLLTFGVVKHPELDAHMGYGCLIHPTRDFALRVA